MEALPRRVVALLGVALVLAGCSRREDANLPSGFVNGASLHTIRVDNHDRTTSDSITTSTAECADNRSVVLLTVDGGGHEWPSFATAALWQFFATHARWYYSSCAVVEKM